MDFFAQQDHARRQSGRMVALFALAVIAIVLAVNLVAAIVYLQAVGVPPGAARALARVPGHVYLWSTLATLAVIAGGTAYRVVELAQGGTAVAEMVGAQRIALASRDPGERRLLNVVEEMAIASGISVPAVYVMAEERGINAFAAGYSPNEAVVAVTRGTLDALSRDELQGVVAHEFSHILNGDMRLNIHLLGVLNGIVLIGAIGLFLMRNAGEIRSSRDSGAIIMGLFAVGLALTVIGYVGILFARLIKAAVSREREFLADASAVQFTRNPEGIGGALVQIGRQSGLISNRHAEDLSHMYFGQAVKTAMAGLFDTHPPIEERIKRVLGPNARLFQRKRVRQAEASSAASAADQPEAALGFGGGAGSAANSEDIAATASPGAPALGVEWGRRTGDEAVETTAQVVMASIGTPTMEHVDYARQMLSELPEAVRAATRTGDGAKATLFALLIAAGGVRERQAAIVAGAGGEAVWKQAVEISDAMRTLGERMRMPVLDLAMPTLKALAQVERDWLLEVMQDMVKSDRRVTVAEFVLLTICRRHFAKPPKGAPPVKYKSLEPVAAQVATVISLLVHTEKSGPAAFDAGMAALGLKGQTLLPMAGVTIASVEAALYELKLVAMMQKPALIKACLAVVMADGRLSVAEAELMRAIGAALDTPLPPILENPSPPLEKAA